MVRSGLVALGILFLVGCNVSDDTPMVAPNPCAGVTCSDNGVCGTTPDGAAMCECTTGYMGDDCSACADGFVESDDACVAAAQCEASSCRTNEECDDSTGLIVCTCPSGFIDAEDGCVAAETCTTDICNNGTCDDASGAIVCACEEGYAGTFCDSCDTGYFESGDACVRNVPCAEADPCGTYGTCADSATGVTCECATGYTGNRCDTCAPTHYRAADDTCQERQACASDSCSNRGTCDDSTGVISCTCDATYGGDRCQGCYPGYVDLAGACVLAQTCQPGTCFGNGVCDDTTGLVQCTCDFGYATPFCNECKIGHTGAACETCLPGYTLIGDTCTAICADSLYVSGGETCEDGNTDPSNGMTDFCSSDCSFTNWPDAEWPGFISSLQVYSFVTWSNTVLNQNASRYRVVAPGQAISVTGSYAYNATASGCTGCVTQLYLGIFAKDPANTDPLNKQKQFCASFGGSSTSNFTASMTAPTEPGTYYVRWGRGWDYNCNPPMPDWGMATNMFAIYVTAP